MRETEESMFDRRPPRTILLGKANSSVQIHMLIYCRTEVIYSEFSTTRAAEYIFSVNTSGTARHTGLAELLPTIPANMSPIGLRLCSMYLILYDGYPEAVNTNTQRHAVGADLISNTVVFKAVTPTSIYSRLIQQESAPEKARHD